MIELKPKTPKEKFRAWALDWVETIIVALVLALFIRAFFIQVFWIPSVSMEPTLKIQDRIIVNKLAWGVQNPLFESGKEKIFLYVLPNPFYNRHLPIFDRKYFISFNKIPQRFEVVVFKMYDVQGGRKDLIKRVVGLPGEKIELKKGALFINDEFIKEHHPISPDFANFGPFKIPEGHVFVMGDNRGNSADSRFFGPLPLKNLIGPAFLKIWPLQNFGFIPK